MTVGALSATAAEEQADGITERPPAPQLRRRLERADLRAVPEARRALRELLRHWGRPGTAGTAGTAGTEVAAEVAAEVAEVAEVAELLTSELVTNALVHTDDDAILTATVSPHGLRVEVRDFVAHRPRPCVPRTDDDTNGRGLVLVQSLADAWGVCSHGVGKSVWFELGAGAA